MATWSDAPCSHIHVARVHKQNETEHKGRLCACLESRLSALLSQMARHAQAPDGLKLGEDFPFICEVCLGPNPYLRMIKMPNSRECKISGRPYTAFRWQPGSEARYKETIICAEVAIAKNVCQVCLMDMEYNLPVRVRDQLMGNDNTRGVGGVQMPQSDVNKEFYWQNQRQLLEESSLQGFQALQDNGSAGGSAIGQTFDKLAHLSRNKQGHDKYYDRNLPKLCSFWTRQVRGWG